MKTYSPKPEHIERHWYVVDASGQVLGRLASEVATLLRGKHKPMYAPHMDTGDHVIVINADKVELTGGKATQKYAYHHSGYPGGLRAVRYDELLADRPVAAVQKAVRGMLPKNRLGRQMIKKLHVVAGPEHPHAAQKPLELAVGERPAWDGLPVPAPAVVATTPAASPKADTVVEAETPDAPGEETTTAKKPTAKKPTAKKPTAKKPTAKAGTAEAAPRKKAAAKKTTAAKETPAKAEAPEPVEAPEQGEAPAETEMTEE